MATSLAEGRQQTELFEAMLHPDFYPHTVSAIEQRDTLISRVFLTGDVVYKVKKAVNLGFLDFSTLEKREHFCRREMILNRRLSTDVYLDVVPITRKDDRYYLNGPGRIAEYAVKMQQLPDHCSLLQMLRRKKLDPAKLDELARRLADFYEHAATSTGIETVGAWKTVWTNTEENFRQTREFAGSIFDERMYQIIRAATRAFLRRRKILFQNRLENKKIRDCHGDLRAEHIYFSDDLQIIDCLEFNDRFRYGDITSDLAFLAMDLDFEGFPGVALQLIDAYLEHTGDEELVLLLDFYKCYRAWVRLKVNCFRLRDEPPGTNKKARLLGEIQRYLSLAYRYAVEFTRPTVWVVCGLSASGKSTLSAALAKILAVGIYRSDVVRKQLFDLPPRKSQVVPFEEGIYSSQATSLTYGKLLMLVQQELEHGRSVIVDAGYGKERHREEMIRLARDADANILFVECAAPVELLKKRLQARSKTGGVSDARRQHLKLLMAGFESMDGMSSDFHLRVSTATGLDESLGQVLGHDYALLCRQVATLMQKMESDDIGGL